MRSKFALSWVVGSLLACASLGSAQTAKTSHKHKSKPKPKVEEQAAQPLVPPPPPPTPEQLPSREPTVTYQDGQLTILAPNSTLGDILRAVRTKTGASIDIPPGANERVVSKFGPGPARDVLAKLLNGTNFNYVMIGTAADPATVAQLILTLRKEGADSGINGPVYQASQPNGLLPSGVVGRRGFNPRLPQNQLQSSTNDDSNDGMEEDAQDNGDANDDTTASDQAVPEQGNAADQQPNPAQPQVKTPEQLLRELQRQQQLLQRQQPQQQQPQQQQQPAEQPQIVHPVQSYPPTAPPQS